MGSFHYRFLQEQKAKFISSCDLCGKCVRKCPVFPHVTLRNHKPKDVQTTIISNFNEGSLSEATIEFALSCSNCLRCDVVCKSEGLYPSRRSEIIKSEMHALGKPFTERASFFLPQEKYFAFEVLSRLLLKPSEMRWLSIIPKEPQKTDVLFFIGCTGQITPEKIFTAMEILSTLTFKVVTLGGGVSACCGGLHTFLGRIEEGEKLAESFLKNVVKAFNPQTIVFWCPTCLSVLTSKFSSYLPPSIRYQHISTFLAENMDRLPLTRNIDKVVTVHNSCHLGRGLGEYEAPRKILSCIPGIKLVEMRHAQEDGLCCGAAAGFFHPALARELSIKRLNEAKESGAEIVTTLCTSCQTTLLAGEFTHGLSIRFLTDLVGEAMGISYGDSFKRVLTLGSIKAIIEAARENIKASTYTIEDMERLLPVILGTG